MTHNQGYTSINLFNRMCYAIVNWPACRLEEWTKVVRFGLLEIGVIIVIAFLILGVVRLRRGVEYEVEAPASVSRRKTRVKPARHPRIQIMGLIVIIVGVVLFLVYFNLGKVIFWGNIWALLAVTVGALILLLARRI